MRNETSSPWLRSWLMALGLCLAFQAGAAEPSTAEVRATYGLVAEGRDAWEAKNYAEAVKLLERAMASPGFPAAEPDIQFFTFTLAGFSSGATEDFLAAHEYMSLAAGFPQADAEIWHRRAAYAAIVEKWEDAALSLSTLARKWPKELQGDEHTQWMVFSTSRELSKKSAMRDQRLSLLAALFDAEYKSEFGTEPSYLWSVLAVDAVQRGDEKRARTVLRRISSPAALVELRIDKQFDALLAKEPKLFDVPAAAQREARLLEKASRDNPDRLGPLVQYGYALYTLGKFPELHALAEAVIARVEKSTAAEPLYSDLDDQLNWIYNHKASALRAMGKWEEAAMVLSRWEHSESNKADKVSQAINLGFFYNEMGKPEEALKAIEALDWSNGMSGYGRTQCQYVRFQAYQALGKDSQVQEIVAWMREHQADSPGTAQSVLLESGDVDGAAELLLSRLRNAEDRSDALGEIQIYAATPRTQQQRKLDALKESLLTRADVAAGIAEYGRREKHSIYTMEY